LFIESVSTSCGCVTAFKGEIRLEPGDKYSLPVRVNTSAKSVGEFHGTVSMHLLNETNTRIVQIPITATLARRGELQCDPGVLSFGVVAPGEAVSRSFKCRSHDEFSLSEASVRILKGPAWLDANIESREKMALDIVLKGTAPMRTGTIADVLQLAIGDHVTSLPVQATICSTLAFEVTNVTKVLSPEQPVFEQDLKLLHAEGERFDVREVKYEGSHAELVTIETRGPEDDHKIRVAVRPAKVGREKLVRGSVVASCLVDGDEIEVALPLLVVRR
jgi:hypothetical protein